MTRKQVVATLEDIADESKVRLGDAALYFDPSADVPTKTPPADIADEGAVRLGDSSIYFDPAADELIESAA
jgi:hypothetical protein